MGSDEKSRPQQPGTQIQVRLQPAALAALDQFRASEADLPSRPEALRRLAAEGSRPRATLNEGGLCFIRGPVQTGAALL